MSQEPLAEELVELIFQLSHKPDLEHTQLVTRGEGALLTYLALNHNGATSGELRDALDVGSGRVANALKNLEAKQLVTRTRSATDGRVVRVYLTPRGQELILERYHRLLSRMEGLIQALGEEDSRELLRLTRRIIALSAGRHHPSAS